MESSEVPRITCEELKKLVDKGERPVIIDTRNSASYSREHIQGAVNIYYNPSSYPIDRELMLTALPANRLLVFYCDCLDDSTSADMALELVGLGYDADKIRALSKGFSRWQELGFPVDKP
jgi:rhodanese-related sulfurtransferase